MPTKQDKEKVEIFKKELKELLKDIVPIWFFDESGVWAGSKPRKVLATKGSKPTYPYNGEHIRLTVMGAVNSKTGQGEFLIMPRGNTDTFQKYIDYFNTINDNKPNVLVLDNASWHKTKKLNWGNVIPFFLPSYSSTINPIERLWKVLKDMIPCLSEISNKDQLEDIIIHNLQRFINNPQEVKSICRLSE